MRLIGVGALVLTLALTSALSGDAPAARQDPNTRDTVSSSGRSGDGTLLQRIGRLIFRFDTFGDEQLWTGELRMHEVLPTIDPKTALSVGLKVDVDALPAEVIEAIRTNPLLLTDPAITVELLRLNAVVGVRGRVDASGTLTSVGITCALCHSTVDDSLADGIGHRLDGWANGDLNVGQILSLSPAPVLDPFRTEFLEWGPGMYDPRHHYFDGTRIVLLNEPSKPVVIPAIFGLKGTGFETYTGDGPISYWNSYVGVSQMGGHGNFDDRRIGVTITQTPDLVTPKLPALLAYQLSLLTPAPPPGSFDSQAAMRGRRLFRNEAGCVRCHLPPNFTDVLSGPQLPFLHDPSEVGQDDAYAKRSATGKYRTTPLRGLWQHPPYFHDGSAPDLLAVVNHYNELFRLNLTEAQKADLVAYLKSL